MDLTNLEQQLTQAPTRDAFVEAIQTAVASADPQVIPLLIRALRSTDSGICEQIVVGLVSFGEQAVQPLLQNLDDHDYAARHQQFRALVQLAHPDSFETFVWGLREDFAPSVRRVAARGLAVLGERRAVPILLSVLQDPDWAVRYAVVLALEAFLPSPEVQTALQKLAQDPERIIRLKVKALANQETH